MVEQTIYDRQQELRLHIPRIATIVGCGGTGFWTGVFLAMSGTEELILVDEDRVEATNLNRLPLTRDHIAFPKTDMLKGFIKKLREGARVETQNMKIGGVEDCQVLRGTVFCCTDNLKSQQLICAHCKKNNLPYQRVGYDGTVLNVSKGFPLSFSENGRDGYRVVPSWVVPAALAAALGVSSQCYKEICIMNDISKLATLDSSYVPQSIREVFRQEGEYDILENISDHIPDGYGYCEDCEQCDGCKNLYTDDDMAEAKEARYQDGYDAGFEAGKQEAEKEAREAIKEGGA